ncbi:MAG: ABC transporter permease, partial [Jatrophihabitans sp.]
MTMSVGEFEVSNGPGDSAPMTPTAVAAIQGRSLWAIAWRRLRQDRVAMAGGIAVIVLVLIAIFARYLSAWYGVTPNQAFVSGLDASTTMPIGSFGGMTGSHWLGITPVTGNDIFVDVLYGLRTSLIIGGISTLLSLVLGLVFGTIAGYFG